MDQMACVNIPRLPLQLLLKQHPQWRQEAVVLVDHRRAAGKVLDTNHIGKQLGIRPGMRYPSARALAKTLHADSVSASVVDDTIACIFERLLPFSPRIEPSSEEPGIFWLALNGINRLYPSLAHWAKMVRTRLQVLGFANTVVVGFSRYGTYAISKVRQGSLVMPSREDERAVAEQVPLRQLALPTDLKTTMHKLNIKTVAAFLELPAAGLAQRFGPDSQRIQAQIADRLWEPLRGRQLAPIYESEYGFEPPTHNLSILGSVLHELLTDLLSRLRQDRQMLATLHIRLSLDNQTQRHESLTPAEPTVDVDQLDDLAQRRLDTLKLPAAVADLYLKADATPWHSEQLPLISSHPRKISDANQALARLRSSFGPNCMRRAKAQPQHLPEQSFTWEPVQHIQTACPTKHHQWPLVRRFYPSPRALEHKRDSEAESPTATMMEQASAPTKRAVTKPLFGQQLPQRLIGPFLLEAHWWRSALKRAYYFAETHNGTFFWVYYDYRRRQWLLQGQVA